MSPDSAAVQVLACRPSERFSGPLFHQLTLNRKVLRVGLSAHEDTNTAQLIGGVTAEHQRQETEPAAVFPTKHTWWSSKRPRTATFSVDGTVRFPDVRCCLPLRRRLPPNLLVTFVM